MSYIWQTDIKLYNDVMITNHWKIVILFDSKGPWHWLYTIYWNNKNHHSISFNGMIKLGFHIVKMHTLTEEKKILLGETVQYLTVFFRWIHSPLLNLWNVTWDDLSMCSRNILNVFFQCKLYISEIRSQ